MLYDLIRILLQVMTMFTMIMILLLTITTETRLTSMGQAVLVK